MRKLLTLLVFVFAVFLFGWTKVRAQECTNISSPSVRITCLENQLSRLSAQSKTLSNQIAQFDAQIRLTALKIAQTEEKILLLGGRIDQIETSLTELSNAFSSRAVETYKMTRSGLPLFLLFSSKDVDEAVARYHYLSRIQEADRDLLTRLQGAQTTYKNQKEEEETLKKELNDQKSQLDKQKKEKANLLAVTRNDEKRYQQLLAAARAELAVVLGGGKETFLRDVPEGEVIGRVLPTASGCSSGQHLHFEVHQGGSIKDPNEYLRPISFSYNYSPDQYGYYGTINPRGSWNWPMNEPIEINQGYGSYGFAKTFYSGGVHTGIDMDSSSSNAVKSVKAGKLYGGSYQCGGAYPGALLYAKVDQGDGFTTWYLHMTPQ